VKPIDLRVPVNKVVRISHEESHGGLIRYLRPKTVVALKTLSGVPVRRPARLGDAKAFEIIEDRDAVERLVPLLPDKAGKIGGVPYSFVHALITSFDEKDPIPTQVRIVQRFRKREDLHAKRSLINLPIPPESPDKEWRRQFAFTAEVIGTVQEMPVPDWLRNLMACATCLVYYNLVVETNGTLVVGSFISNLWASNVYMHQGARVAQESPYLTVDITGELKGDLP
jgi:hypothetical protein